MQNDPRAVRKALALSAAKYRISDDAVASAAKVISQSKHKIRGIDVCERGICLDYIVDDEIWEVMPELAALDGARLRDIDVFPWGIIDPDIFRISVTHEVEGFVGIPG